MEETEFKFSDQQSIQALITELSTEAELLELQGPEIKKYIQDGLREARLAARNAEAQRKLEMEKFNVTLAYNQRMEEEKLAYNQKMEEEKLAHNQKMEEEKLGLEKQKLEQNQKMEEEKLGLEKQKLEQDRHFREAEIAAKREKVVATKEQTEIQTALKSRPKPPYFRDDKDDMDSYLIRFEEHAKLRKWPKVEWTSYLRDSLSGKALSCFTELVNIDGIADYDTVKKHLLTRFHFTEEGFRQKFRSSRPQPDETFHVFADRLKRYFRRWLDMAGIEKHFDKLVDLLLREQFLSSCSQKLTIFLKSQLCASINEMTDAAERFREAQPKEPLAVAEGQSNPIYANIALGTETQSNKPPMRGTPTSDRRRFPFFRGMNRNQVNPTKPNSTYGVSEFTHRPTHIERQFPRTARPNTQRNIPFVKSEFCFTCHQPVHYSRQCSELFKLKEQITQMQKELAAKQDKPQTANRSSAAVAVEETIGSVGLSVTQGLPMSLTTCHGTINGQSVTVMLDSGCTTVGVRKSLLMKTDISDKTIACKLFSGDIMHFPVATVNLDCPYFTGSVEACVLENPVCDVILGCIPGATFACSQTANAAVTRAQTKRHDPPFRPILTAKTPQLNVTPTDLRELQQNDDTLSTCFQKTGKGTSQSGEGFAIRDNMLFRVTNRDQSITWQLMVPKALRESVLIAAHDGLVGGHMGQHSTSKRILPYFFWPGIHRDIKQYCRSCHICQVMYPKGRVQMAPLQSPGVVDVPFSRVAVDIVGPITPPSSRGHRYILTCVDIATRYPEAVPLKSITATEVGEALFNIFTHTGFPDEILSDRGTQFTSDIMRELYRLMSISQLLTSPYHPQTNGVVERFNATLKTMLKKLMTTKPKDWDRYLPATLFAYREIPQASTGFSPFELLYGRVPKGPSAILYQAWTGSSEANTQPQPVHEYISNLKDIITESVSVAQDSIQEKAKKWKQNQASTVKLRNLGLKSKVLVLLPSTHNKLRLQWRGPYTVIKRTSPTNYLIDIDGAHKIYHINLLKEFHERVDSLQHASIAVINASELVDNDLSKVHIVQSPTNGESKIPVQINPNLSRDQDLQVHRLLEKHGDVLTETPGLTTMCHHEINLTDNTPFQVKQFPLPFTLVKTVKEEVDKMLSMDIIEPSKSPYASPVLLVKKKDATFRFCVDFRKLNAFTVFDAEPIPDIELLFAKLKGKRFFTKIDLTKGYWQIPLRPQDKEKTAFRTQDGLFQFTRMPFGLITAPSTFARMMRKLNLSEFESDNFFDDILLSTYSWQEHIKCLGKLFQRLHESGLTARPDKVEVAYEQIEYLGHVISKDSIRPQDEKLTKVFNLQQPETKKQVRALLGLVNFYRRYIPKLATILAPLTDLTKKGSKNKIIWTAACEDSLKQIKTAFSTPPVLRLPDFSKQFIIRSDASAVGIGAVLMQKDEQSLPHPVMYASRKLSECERKYPTVERECLSVVWGIDRFHRFIYGQQFILETDHRPLTFLRKSSSTNQRLTRWALALQEYAFTVLPIPGSSNREADVLSRITL